MIEQKGMVFKNEHETNGEKWYSYNFSVSSKNQKGEWESASCPIKFVGGCIAPEDKTRIVLKDGWQKPFKFKDGNVLGWYAKEYEVVSEPQGEIHGYSALVQDEIPFR